MRRRTPTVVLVDEFDASKLEGGLLISSHRYIQVALYVREFHFRLAKIQLLRVFDNNTIINASVTRYLLPLTPGQKISTDARELQRDRIRATPNALPVMQLSTALEYASAHFVLKQGRLTIVLLHFLQSLR